MTRVVQSLVLFIKINYFFEKYLIVKKLNTVPDKKILLIIKGLNLHVNRVRVENVKNKNDGNVSFNDRLHRLSFDSKSYFFK